MRRLAFVFIVVACGPPARDRDPDGGGGTDGGSVCTDDEFTCFGQILQRCEGGHFVDQQTCPRVCDPSLGCISCLPQVGNTCVDEEVHMCNADGSIGDLVETCTGTESCDGGRCVDLCGDAAVARSYIGCEYWALDLWNAQQVSLLAPFLGTCFEGTPATLPVCWSGQPAGLCDNGTDCSAAPMGFNCQTREVCLFDAQNAPYAIVVANPSLTSTAQVTIATPGGGSGVVNVPPGGVETIFPQMAPLLLPNQSLAWSSIEAKAYHVTSTRPIVAYQFNPLDNVGVFSNDASLLLPVHTYDTKYFVVTQASVMNRPNHHDWGGYVTILAPAPTTVAVTPTAAVKAGLGGAPAIAAGATQMVTLTAGQAWTLEAVGGADLTGTVVESTDGVPFAAFAGHVAAVISTLAAPCCADHLEDQLFPTSTWGKKYAVARTLVRGLEGDKLRIVAQSEDTSISFSPPIASCPTLLAGEWCEVDVSADVEITANHPILVAQFLYSVGSGSVTNPQGDPALAFMVPVEQFRLAYDLLVPSQYRTNFFAIVAPATGPVILDGVNVEAQLTPFGSMSWRAGRVLVEAGPHRLECGGCGVTVGGYDSAVSYLFAGGLNLEQIVIPD